MDGLRGITILMVVLGHYTFLWPDLPFASIPIVQGLFMGGAVVIFFVIGGFVVTRVLLRELAVGTFDPIRFYGRRIVRLGVELVPLVLVILFIHAYDSTDPSNSGDTWASVTNILTYTWNYYAINNVFSARGDLGHLWYLSVQQQVYLVLPLAVLLLAKFRRTFAVILVALSVLVVINRFMVLSTDGWLKASLLTTTRADALLLGVLIAVGLPLVSRLRLYAAHVLAASLGVLTVLVMVHGFFGATSFLSGWGLAFTAVATSAVGALASGGPTGRVGQLLAGRWLVSLGNASLPIYVWHVPVFVTLARHTAGWHPGVRTAVGLLILTIVVALAQRFIEIPTRAWLRTSPVFRATTASGSSYRPVSSSHRAG
jgi:peptidoglycan/LPS O-acetylase OafA/YrhL